MRKFNIGLLLLGVMLSVSVRAQTNEEIYRDTIKQVDTAGLSLEYVRHVNTSAKLLEKLSSILQVAGNQKPANAPFIPMVQMGIGFFFKLLNVDAVQAHAISCVYNEADKEFPYLYKSFAYTGNNPQGLGYEFYSRTNQPFRKLTAIPPNTLIAFGGHLTLDSAWDYLVGEFAKDPSFQQLPAVMTATLEQKTGVKLPEILKTLRGEFFFLLTSSGTAENPVYRIIWSLPDAEGTLARLLEQFSDKPEVSKVSDNVYAIEAPDSASGLNPQITVGDKRIMIVSDPAAMPEINLNVQGGLKVPEQGIMYSYISIDEATVRGFGKRIPAEQLNLFKTFIGFPRIYCVASVGPLGYQANTRTNIELPQFGSFIPLGISAGALLPVLQKARMKAQGVAAAPAPRDRRCSTNLKQIGLALMQYAMDNKDMLPPGKNEKGFEVLKAKEYLTDLSVYRCPHNPQEQYGYYYLGLDCSMTQVRTPSTMPIAFDKPGNHAGTFSVLFLDGHVEELPLENYRSPVDVINMLHQKYKYPPEVLEVLLQKCRDN